MLSGYNVGFAEAVAAYDARSAALSLVNYDQAVAPVLCIVTALTSVGTVSFAFS